MCTTNIERYTKAAAAVQNAIQCYCVIYDEKKRATTQTSPDRFFKRVDRIESSKEPEAVPSTSGVSDIAACPPSPIADDPSALPSYFMLYFLHFLYCFFFPFFGIFHFTGQGYLCLFDIWEFLIL